ELAQILPYDIAEVRESNETFVVASDDGQSGRGPTLIINAGPRKDVILEAPHMPFEPGTGEQAVTLLRDLGGRAAIISGAHRCASRSFTTCDGKTAVCGSLEGYRDSDAGHNVSTMFNVAHRVLAERWNQSIVVSLHGMKEDETGRTQIIVSNGVRGDDKDQ